MIAQGSLFHKPKSFLSARQSIYASILVGVLAVSIRVLSAGINAVGGVPGLSAIIIFYGIIVLLVNQMSKVRKWARTTMLVLYILAMLIYPVVIAGQIQASVMVAILLFIQSALIIYALVLVYNKECTEWFNSEPSERKLP